MAPSKRHQAKQAADHPSHQQRVGKQNSIVVCSHHHQALPLSPLYQGGLHSSLQFQHLLQSFLGPVVVMSLVYVGGLNKQHEALLSPPQDINGLPRHLHRSEKGLPHAQTP